MAFLGEEGKMAPNPTSPESERTWPRRRGPMSEEAFHELENLDPEHRYEYIDGVAYMMSGGSVGHDRILYNARSALEARLRSGPCTVFGVDVQVLLGFKKSGQKQYVYPDATVSCNPADSRLDNTLIEAPRVVIEVLSPSTEAKDRGVKFRAYQQCPTIQEIALVDQFAQYVQVWQRDEQDPTLWRYRHYGPGETVEFASIDVHFEIEELYRGLTFLDEDEDEDE
jgi:Uma2 family endonuclease